jgi:hypothetical protein
VVSRFARDHRLPYVSPSGDGSALILNTARAGVSRHPATGSASILNPVRAVLRTL